MADNFLDEELSSDPVGGEALVTQTKREDEAAANAQSWTDTLGITNDEDDTTLVQGVKDTFTSGGNWGYDIFQDVRRMYDNTPDPEWNPQQYLTDNADKLGISVDYFPSFAATGSLGEATDLLHDIREREEARTRIQKMGVTGQLTAGIIAGVADIDTLVSGGFAVVGKAGIMSTRIGKIMAGTATGTIAATAGAAASPEDDWANVAVAALFSAGVATGATALHSRINRGLDNAVDDLDEALKAREAGIKVDGPEPLPEANPAPWVSPEVKARQQAAVDELTVSEKVDAPVVKDPLDEAEFGEANADVADDIYTRQLGGSAGAAQLFNDRIGIKLSDQAALDVQTYAKDLDKQFGFTKRFFDDFAPALNSAASGVAKTVRRATDVINKVGLGADMDKFMKSGSPTARALAYLGMRDPAGRTLNNANAASFQQTFQQELFGQWHAPYTDARKQYTKKLGFNKFAGLATPSKRRAAEREFDKAVWIEQENMRLNGAYSANVSPEVKQAAEAMDRWSLAEHRIAVGDGVTTDLPGWTEFDPYRGYAPRQFDSGGMYRWLAKNKLDYNAGRTTRLYTEKDIEDAFAGYYSSPLSGIDKRTARKVAKMVMTHAQNRDTGGTTDLTALYNSTKPDAFHAMMDAAGISKKEADELVKRIKAYGMERKQQAHTKNRIDGDIRYVHPNGIKIIDFVNTDYNNVLSRRSRSTAGRAALARGMGIRTDDDIQAWKTAIMHEMQDTVQEPIGFSGSVQGVKSGVNDLLDRDVKISEQDVQGFFDQFTGGQIKDDAMAGFVMRGKRWAGMASLGNTGLWQIAETSNLVGAAGWQEFIKQLPNAIKKDLTNPRSELIQELRVLGKFIPEERLTDPYYYSELNQSLASQSDTLYWIDRIGAKGMQMQGMLSGMFKIKEWQHNLSTFVAVDKLFRAAAGKPGAFNEARLLQMGASPDFINDLKTVLSKNVIEWDGDSVKRLNIDKWGDGNLEYRLLNTLNAFTDQQVQRTIAGETNMLFAGNGVASLFTQFLSYPMNAINKQFARQAYAGDTEAMLTAMYGFLFGGTVGLAKTTISGKYEDLDMEHFAKSGFQNGNLTGWAPTLADPLLSLIGAEDWRFNPYGQVIRNPPAISVLNSVAMAPQSIAGIIMGDRSAENIRNARMLPVLGNLPPWTAILNQLKDD